MLGVVTQHQMTWEATCQTLLNLGLQTRYVVYNAGQLPVVALDGKPPHGCQKGPRNLPIEALCTSDALLLTDRICRYADRQGQMNIRMACGCGNSSRQVDTHTMMTFSAVVFRAVSATTEAVRLSETRLPLHSAMACAAQQQGAHTHKIITQAQKVNSTDSLEHKAAGACRTHASGVSFPQGC
jgi:hypothetical protein